MDCPPESVVPALIGGRIVPGLTRGLPPGAVRMVRRRRCGELWLFARRRGPFAWCRGPLTCTRAACPVVVVSLGFVPFVSSVASAATAPRSRVCQALGLKQAYSLPLRRLIPAIAHGRRPKPWRRPAVLPFVAARPGRASVEGSLQPSVAGVDSAVGPRSGRGDGRCGLTEPGQPPAFAWPLRRGWRKGCPYMAVRNGGRLVSPTRHALCALCG